MLFDQELPGAGHYQEHWVCSYKSWNTKHMYCKLGKIWVENIS